MKLGFGRPTEALQEGSFTGEGSGHEPASYGRRETASPGTLPRDRLWIRGAAFGLDLLFLGGGPLLLAATVAFAVLMTAPEPPLALGRGFQVAQAAFVVLFLGRDAGGGSPGKRLLGLRIVRVDGARTSLATSLVRNLPLLIPGWNLVEAASVLRRRDGRRPGDRAARTAVVEC
jgi:uncharacterized RDD family membrane protein YckC